MKDEREILTREIISQKLKRDAKRSVVGAVLMLIPGALVAGLMHAMTQLASPSPSLLALLAEIVVDAAFVTACAVFFVRGILQLNRVRRGEFSVTEDILLSIEDNRLSFGQMLLTGRLFDRSNYVHDFKFLSGKRFVIGSEQSRNTHLSAAAGFSLPEDAFLLVSFNAFPDKVVWIYSCKIYHCKTAEDMSPR